jgi:hypothetical protein
MYFTIHDLGVQVHYCANYQDLISLELCKRP